MLLVTTVVLFGMLCWNQGAGLFAVVASSTFLAIYPALSLLISSIEKIPIICSLQSKTWNHRNRIMTFRMKSLPETSSWLTAGCIWICLTYNTFLLNLTAIFLFCRKWTEIAAVRNMRCEVWSHPMVHPIHMQSISNKRQTEHTRMTCPGQSQ